ncbi:flagellin [Poseidonibacter sp.]|uniref:flagellin N-terminal helical domain-containing protein n=1 Tax=Poseidonibacter sp. TaxID=2321188 RepID=UPI003C71B8BD
MIINTNTAATEAQNLIRDNNKLLNQSLERLSTGRRIVDVNDDVSGLSIANKLRTQVLSIRQSIEDGNSAVALTQIADKALAEQSNILDIVKTKLIQASTATTSTAGRKAISKDVSKLLLQLDNISSQTNYNGMQLLQKASDDIGIADSLTFQLGDQAKYTLSTGNTVQANTTGLSLTTLTGKVSAGITSSSAMGISSSDARVQMLEVDQSLDRLNGWRADFGSTQSQLESAVRNLSTQETNIANAESIIRDVDYAKESANFAKRSMIAQAGAYALSQANVMQQDVMRLLQ